MVFDLAYSGMFCLLDVCPVSGQLVRYTNVHHENSNPAWHFWALYLIFNLVYFFSFFNFCMYFLGLSNVSRHHCDISVVTLLLPISCLRCFAFPWRSCISLVLFSLARFFHFCYSVSWSIMYYLFFRNPVESLLFWMKPGKLERLTSVDTCNLEFSFFWLYLLILQYVSQINAWNICPKALPNI